MNPLAPDEHADAPRQRVDVPPRPPLPASMPASGGAIHPVTHQDPLDAALDELGISPTQSPSRSAAPSVERAGPVERQTASPAPRAEVRTRQVARTTLIVYTAVLALIGFWPSRVDAPAGSFLRGLTHVIPWATYARIEFGANILLFVPLGVLLALILTHRYLILPIALVTSVAIESLQAVVLARRVPSVMDIVANLTGACIGLLIVVFLEWWRQRRRDDT